MLQQKGYRESDNREFFRAPVSEVIQIIIKMPAQFSSNSDFEDDKDAEFFSSESDDELDEFVLDDEEDEEPDYPWLALWEMAENYRYGNDDYIQDCEEALELYKQAIKLGCLPAYEKIGEMYRLGEGVSKNSTKALDWFKEGVKKGNYYCYAGMGDIFAFNKQYDNFHKCYKSLFKQHYENSNKLLESFNLGFGVCCASYIGDCFLHKVVPQHEIVSSLSSEKEHIILSINERIDCYSSFEENERDFLVPPLKTALKWIEENL
jgi:TPR repeat protein